MAGIEKKHLEFTIDLHNVQFNHLGKYELKLTVQSSFTRDYTRVKLSHNEGTYLPSHATKTGIVTQQEKNAYHQFYDQKFSFFLPRGFCKNDNRHDIYLLVEAFELSTSSGGTAKRVGEAKYAIYPRTNAPRANLHAPPGDDMYRATDVMTLLRTLSSENLKMHCGRLKYTSSLKQILKPPKELTGVTPTPEPSTMTPDSLAPQKSLPTPVVPKLPRSPLRKSSPSLKSSSLPPEKKVIESPPGSGQGRHGKGSTKTNKSKKPLPGAILSKHVSSPGRESIVVIVHAADNLPALADGRVPIPFCSAKTKSDEDLGRKGHAVTSASQQPTHRPVWEEVMEVDVLADDSPEEVLIVNVADKPTKELLAGYRIPVHFLTPFHSYNLQMFTPSMNAPSGVSLFATIIRKCPSLPRDQSSPNYIALEVTLQGVREKLANPIGPLVAAARVVPDYYTYKFGDDHGASTSRSFGGVTPTEITFPSPPSSAFTVSPNTSQGYPQITLPGYPADQPEWHHAFLFCQSRDKATLFTPGAALVLEFYPADDAMKGQMWELKKPVGYAAVLLDQGVYLQLTTHGGEEGVKIEGLPVQGTSLMTVDDKTPTLGGVLRLITSDRPSPFVPTDTMPVLDLSPASGSVSDVPLAKSPPPVPEKPSTPPHPAWTWSEDLLSVGSSSGGTDRDLSSPPTFPQQQQRVPPHHRRPYILDDEDTEGRSRAHLQRRAKRPMMPIKDGELPPHDALESILPEYQYIFVDPQPKGRVPGQAIANNLIPDELERGTGHLLDHQMRELEKYRTAVHKMGQDILTLREQIRDAEVENSRLRRDLARYNDATRLLMDSQELDGLTKPELASRYVALKQKLTSQTGQLQNYKDTVHRLQNDLIKKNDAEKDLMRMTHAHESQNELLQRLQDKAQKVKRLEEACRKQEKVIEKMEKLLSKASPTEDSADRAVKDENRRLRAEVANLRDALRERPSGSQDDTEKLQAYEKLEGADSRIRSLEKQLSENARKWGRERSDLLVKLQEAEHGFWRSAPLHFDYINPKVGKDPPPSDTDSPRRYSKPPSKQRYGQTRSPKLDPIYH